MTEKVTAKSTKKAAAPKKTAVKKAPAKKAAPTGLEAQLYTLAGESAGTIALPKEVFGIPWKPELVQQVSVAQAANARRPWAHAKDRSEVRGGGRKPWRQKGTGRARHGSTRSPIWIGGGKAHGPRNERDYSQKVNKKMRRTALFSVLSQMAREGRVRVFESLAIAEAKTKSLFAVCSKVNALKKGAKKIDAVIVPTADNKNIFRASRNLVKAKALAPESLNVRDILLHKTLFIDQAALPLIAKHYGGKTAAK